MFSISSLHVLVPNNITLLFPQRWCNFWLRIKIFKNFHEKKSSICEKNCLNRNHMSQPCTRSNNCYLHNMVTQTHFHSLQCKRILLCDISGVIITHVQVTTGKLTHCHKPQECVEKMWVNGQKHISDYLLSFLMYIGQCNSNSHHWNLWVGQKYGFYIS